MNIYSVRVVVVVGGAANGGAWAGVGGIVENMRLGDVKCGTLLYFELKN